MVRASSSYFSNMNMSMSKRKTYQFFRGKLSLNGPLSHVSFHFHKLFVQLFPGPGRWGCLDPKVVPIGNIPFSKLIIRGNFLSKNGTVKEFEASASKYLVVVVVVFSCYSRTSVTWRKFNLQIVPSNEGGTQTNQQSKLNLGSTLSLFRSFSFSKQTLFGKNPCFRISFHRFVDISNGGFPFCSGHLFTTAE